MCGDFCPNVPYSSVLPDSRVYKRMSRRRVVLSILGVFLESLGFVLVDLGDV